jgi:ADP-heptose:LPS heptosyltransferase
MPEFKNILVIRLSAMGDVAMTLPVIASFVAKYPDIRLTMLSNPRFAGMFAGIGNIDFIGVDTKREYKGLNGIFRLFRHLASGGKFDAVIDLHNVLRSKILCTLFKLKNIPVFTVEKGRKENKKLTRSKNKKLVPLKSTVKRYHEVFEKAGLEFALNFSALFCKNADLAENIRLVTGEKKEKWIAIAPFAHHLGKTYPLEKMKKFIEHFSQKEDVKLLLFGGGLREAQILEKLQEDYPRTISLAGKFKLTEELQILNRSDVLISMDSANMHLASLVGTPVISIWGATHPFAGFYGFNQDADNIIQTDLPCRPCSIYGNKPCCRKDYACLNSICTEHIIHKTESFLEKIKQTSELFSNNYTHH